MLKFLIKACSSLLVLIFSITGMALSGIPIYFKLNETISIKILLPICFIVFFVTTILVRALHLAATQINLPRIRKGLETYEPYNDFSFLALLDPYMLFTFNTLFSVFSISDEVEELIGTGRVINVQINGMLLIGVLLFEGKENLIKLIVQNSKETLKKLVIKPMMEI